MSASLSPWTRRTRCASVWPAPVSSSGSRPEPTSPASSTSLAANATGGSSPCSTTSGSATSRLDSGTEPLRPLAPEPVGRGKLAEVERRAPHPAASFAVDLRRRRWPGYRRRGRRPRGRGGRRRGAGRRLRKLVSFGVHALHVRHVVTTLRRHLTAFRPLDLLRGELTTGSVVHLELLGGLSAARQHQNSRTGRDVPASCRGEQRACDEPPLHTPSFHVDSTHETAPAISVPPRTTRSTRSRDLEVSAPRRAGDRASRVTRRRAC